MYPLYRLSALLSLALTQIDHLLLSSRSIDTTTDTPVCSIPLCLLTSLQPTIRSAPRQRRHRFGVRPSDRPLSSVRRRYCTRTDYLLYMLLWSLSDR
jgi:hypothetical protein